MCGGQIKVISIGAFIIGIDKHLLNGTCYSYITLHIRGSWLVESYTSVIIALALTPVLTLH